jgi:hypothetical protein
LTEDVAIALSPPEKLANQPSVQYYEEGIMGNQQAEEKREYPDEV